MKAKENKVPVDSTNLRNKNESRGTIEPSTFDREKFDTASTRMWVIARVNWISWLRFLEGHFAEKYLYGISKKV